MCVLGSRTLNEYDDDDDDDVMANVSGQADSCMEVVFELVFSKKQIGW